MPNTYDESKLVVHYCQAADVNPSLLMNNHYGCLAQHENKQAVLDWLHEIKANGKQKYLATRNFRDNELPDTCNGVWTNIGKTTIESLNELLCLGQDYEQIGGPPYEWIVTNCKRIAARFSNNREMAKTRYGLDWTIVNCKCNSCKS